MMERSEYNKQKRRIQEFEEIGSRLDRLEKIQRLLNSNANTLQVTLTVTTGEPDIIDVVDRLNCTPNKLRECIKEDIADKIEALQEVRAML